MNSKVLTLTLIIAGLLLSALIARSSDLALMTLPFLFYLGIGIAQAPQPGKIRLVAERSIHQETGSDGMTIKVKVTVRNEGEAVGRLVLSDSTDVTALITEGSLTTITYAGSGGAAELHYVFQTSRGSYRWATVHARMSDPFGLIEVEQDLAAEGEVEVQPAVQKFRHIPLRPRHTLHAPGPIPARIAGTGTDFWGVREYHPGDSLRWLDWRLTARHPRKFFTKEFEEEEIADIGLILDARELTNLSSAGKSLFEYAIEAAAALAEVFLRAGNRVSMLIYGENITRLFPGYGKPQLNRVLRTLAKTAPGSSNSLNSLDYLPARLFPKHAFIIIISPLSPSDWQLFPRLRAHGFEVMLISPDPVDFAAQILPAHTANPLAIRAAHIERRLQLKRIAKLRIPVIDWQVQQPLASIVHEALSRSRKQRERI